MKLDLLDYSKKYLLFLKDIFYNHSKMNKTKNVLRCMVRNSVIPLPLIWWSCQNQLNPDMRFLVPPPHHLDKSTTS